LLRAATVVFGVLLALGFPARAHAGNDLCAGFPPPTGEKHTLKARGFPAITTSVEQVPEQIGGYTVYRIHSSDSPPGLGLYIGCDPLHGEVDVATDAYDISDPSDSELLYWEPPLYRCRYGDRVGARCVWSGLFDGDSLEVVTEVLGYESVTVPYGSFENAMKVRETEYEYGEISYGPTTIWVDCNIGLLRLQDSFVTLELTGYERPGGANAVPCPEATRLALVMVAIPVLSVLRRRVTSAAGPSWRGRRSRGHS
jgi:hypothetical protein